VAAIALSLCASLSWGLADFMAGLKSRRLGVLTVLGWVEATGLLIVLAVIVATAEPLPDARTLLYALIAGSAGVAALGAFYRALSMGTMSVVAPISAIGVVLPVIVGLASGDTLTAVIAVGLVASVAGVLLASREEVDELERGGPNRPAVLLALVAAAGFGTYFTFADVAADGSILWLLALGRIVALPFIVGLAVRAGAPLAPTRGDRGQLVLIGTADLAATALYAAATTRGALSIVSVIGGLYPVVTVLLARFTLEERLSATQAAGVALALAGVGMVSAGG
jgi:drug/metabolite transporter (DMT)-like permease